MQQIRDVETRIQSAIACLKRLPAPDRRYVRALRGAVTAWPDIPGPRRGSADWWDRYGTEGETAALDDGVRRTQNLSTLSPGEIAAMDDVIFNWLPMLANGKMPKRLPVPSGDDRLSTGWVVVPDDAAKIVFLRALGKSMRQIMGGRSKLSYGRGGNSRTQIGRVHQACMGWLAGRVTT